MSYWKELIDYERAEERKENKRNRKIDKLFAGTLAPSREKVVEKLTAERRGYEQAEMAEA
jgi:hypothetical protein